MKRKIKSRKQLTNEEARQKIASLQQALITHQDNIHYWEKRIRKKLEFIDRFILGTDKLETPEEFIKMSTESIDWIMWKIKEDYGRFLTEKYKWFIY